MWLVDQATGPLADAIHRDLAGRDFDDLGWRGLWAFITKAPPNTAIHYELCEGWPIPDRIAAEHLYESRKLDWRYKARNFVDGTKDPFPEPIDYPGRAKSQPVKSWKDATLDEMMSPQVKALLQGA